MQTRSIRIRQRAIVAGIGLLTFALVSSGAARAGEPPRVTELMTKPLVGVPGKEVTMLKVEYGPGGADPVHRHDANAFVYVLDGTVEMQMKGGAKVKLGPGETFYEDPAGIHQVGRNTSDSKPASFVVVLVKDQGKPALIPVDE
jgi:quercetin dioxygenase-like cupin family protein